MFLNHINQEINMLNLKEELQNQIQTINKVIELNLKSLLEVTPWDQQHEEHVISIKLTMKVKLKL